MIDRMARVVALPDLLRRTRPGGRVVTPVFGRTDERQAIERFLDARPTATVLVLEGEPGIGKTTLWEAAVEAARERDARVLTARASGAEAHLAFAGLTDLFEGVEDEALSGLATPQRHALEGALLRAAPRGEGYEARAVGLGLLNALRALAADGPLVVAMDDVQWLDAASSEVLTFAARRLHRSPVRLVLARRPGAGRHRSSARWNAPAWTAWRSGRCRSPTPAACWRRGSA